MPAQSAACFWLCLAAGLAESSEGVLAQALPGDHAVSLSLARVRARGVLAYKEDPSHRHAHLGACAVGLRTYFRGGAAAAMTRPDLMAKLYLAFASLDVRGLKSTDSMYRKWVHRLSTS